MTTQDGRRLPRQRPSMVQRLTVLDTGRSSEVALADGGLFVQNLSKELRSTRGKSPEVHVRGYDL